MLLYTLWSTWVSIYTAGKQCWIRSINENGRDPLCLPDKFVINLIRTLLIEASLALLMHAFPALPLYFSPSIRPDGPAVPDLCPVDERMSKDSHSSSAKHREGSPVRQKLCDNIMDNTEECPDR